MRPEQLSRFLPPEEGGRESAVLVLFGEGPDGPDLLLIQRATTVSSHPGQPAFPGGAVDDTDADVVAAALREAEEETGLDPSGVDVFATLPALWLPPSGFVVTPVLGWWRAPSPVGVVDPGEVESVVRVPVAELLDPANRVSVRHPRASSGRPSRCAVCSSGGSPPACCPGCSPSAAGSVRGTPRVMRALPGPPMNVVDYVLLVLAVLAGLAGLAQRPRRRRAVLRRVHRRGARRRARGPAPGRALGSAGIPGAALGIGVIVLAAGIGNAIAGLRRQLDPRRASPGVRPGSSTPSAGSVFGVLSLALVAWVVASALLVVPLGRACRPRCAGRAVLGGIDAVMPQAPAGLVERSAFGARLHRLHRRRSAGSPSTRSSRSRRPTRACSRTRRCARPWARW